MFQSKKKTAPKFSAYDYAVFMLSKADYSKKALAEKMARKYKQAEIADALSRIVEQGYLDEARMVAVAFDSLFEAGNIPVRMIKRKLLEKGFPAEIVAACAESLDYDAIYEHDLNAAQKLASRKFGDTAGLNDDNDNNSQNRHRVWEKIAAFLYRHGFSDEICCRVASELVES